MKMRLTIVYEYDLTDDLAIRQQDYGSTDPDECAAVDSQGIGQAGVINWLEIISDVDLVSYHIEPVKA